LKKNETVAPWSFKGGTATTIFTVYLIMRHLGVEVKGEFERCKNESAKNSKTVRPTAWFDVTG
jgi:hypothetical protein